MILTMVLTRKTTNTHNSDSKPQARRGELLRGLLRFLGRAGEGKRYVLQAWTGFFGGFRVEDSGSGFRVQGHILHRDYVGIIFPLFLLTTSKFRL